jgi:integrase
MPFTVEIIDHASGDQLPLLLDSNGLPEPLPNEFVLGRRHLSANTITRNLREIAVFWRWLERDKIQFTDLIAGKHPLTEAQISTGLIDFLRREQNMGRKVRKIAISPDTFNKRLTTIRQFIEWCFDMEISQGTHVESDYERLVERKRFIHRQLSRHFVASPPENVELRKGLTERQYQYLIELLIPPDAPLETKSQAVAFRNYISTMLMLHYGLRPGELLSLRVEDIEFGAISALRVRRRAQDPNDKRAKRPRIKRGGRVLDLRSEYLAKHLDDYLMRWREILCATAQTDSEYLIVSDEGMPLSHQSVNEFFRLLRENHPGSLPANLSPKSLRHTFSSRMERELRSMGMDEDRRRQALAFLRGDHNLSSQDVYIKQEIREQADIALRSYQKNLLRNHAE